jgi:response regulator RpfG family c-di-GMP phosphodiesterase
MSSKRVYKDAIAFDESFAFLKREAGTIFDPAMVKSFTHQVDAIRKIKNLYHDTEDSVFL